MFLIYDSPPATSFFIIVAPFFSLPLHPSSSVRFFLFLLLLFPSNVLRGFPQLFWMVGTGGQKKQKTFFRHGGARMPFLFILCSAACFRVVGLSGAGTLTKHERREGRGRRGSRCEGEGVEFCHLRSFSLSSSSLLTSFRVLLLLFLLERGAEPGEHTQKRPGLGPVSPRTRRPPAHVRCDGLQMRLIERSLHSHSHLPWRSRGLCVCVFFFFLPGNLLRAFHSTQRTSFSTLLLISFSGSPPLPFFASFNPEEEGRSRHVSGCFEGSVVFTFLCLSRLFSV